MYFIDIHEVYKMDSPGHTCIKVHHLKISCLKIFVYKVFVLKDLHSNTYYVCWKYFVSFNFRSFRWLRNIFNDKSFSNYGTMDMPMDGRETKNFKTWYEVYIEQHHQSNLLKIGVVWSGVLATSIWRAPLILAPEATRATS